MQILRSQPIPRVNRSSFDIAYEVLKKCQSESRKTHIQYSACLSYAQLNKTLRKLFVSGLLAMMGNSYYVSTQKGRLYVQKYEELNQLFKNMKEEK